MVEASKKKKDDAFEWIEKKVVADGNTNIYDALEQAFNIISATKEDRNLRKGADTIFLMTDGLPNRGKFMDQDLIISESKKLNATRKITIHTIGVGEGHDSTFLRNLAAANGGQYIGR
jgi:Mg-chelatase subunit ChlD